MSNSTDRTFLESVTRASSQLFAGAIQANTAAFGAFAEPSTGSRGGERSPDDREAAGTDQSDASDRTAPPEDRIEPDGDLPSWESEVPAAGAGALAVGDRVTFAKTVSDDDVSRFAVASGDTNPVHLDDEYAEGTRFDGRIAHGGLVSGLISAALARFPGTVIYLSQDLEFQAPVRVGDRATAVVEIVEALGDGRFRLRTTVETDEATAVSGEAVVLVEAPPED